MSVNGRVYKLRSEEDIDKLLKRNRMNTMGTFIAVTGFLLLLHCCTAAITRNERRFPDDFLFGTATAAYQIEGGWNADDKGESIWDHLSHTRPELFEDGTNGDVVADSYHNYRRDVEMMRELGLDAYRFSLAWSRILPNGFPNHVSEAGVAFYNNYINEMLKYNIEPMVTLYHWDLPQKLQELGGWANPLVADWFADYARVAYEQFGDRVKFWITMNEPREICLEGYGDVRKAPALDWKGVGEYLCSKNLIMAHAKAWHIYNDEFKAAQGGKIGITISTNTFVPLTDSEDDEAATELLRQAEWKQYAHPIYSEDGDYPKEFKEAIAAKSVAQGFPRSRLPQFTPEEVSFVKGSSDFYGMNHYSARYVFRNESVYGLHPSPSYNDDIDVGTVISEEWTASISPWLQEVPWSLSTALKYIRDTYNNPDIYITENGWSDDIGLVDDQRIHYYRVSLNGVLDALEDGVKVKSYMAWSLMDNIEWLEGITSRFGLYEVDYSDPARTRTPRKSAFVYKHIISNRIIDENYEPDSTVMRIDEGH